MPDPFGGDKPDADGVERLKTHLTQVWQQTHDAMSEMDTFRAGTFNVWPNVLEKRPGYHPPTARYIVDHAVDTQLSVDPKVKKFPAGEGERHKERADRVEPGLTAVLLDAAMREPSIPWRQAYSYLLQYGYTVMGALWDEADKLVAPKRREGEDKDDWEARLSGYEASQVGWNPIRIKAPHPSRVLMNPFEMQPDVAVVVGKRYAQDLANLTKRKGKYGSKRVANYNVEGDPYRLVDTLAVYTPAYHVLKVQGEEILVMERNPFGFMNYCHGFAGWGGEVTDPSDADPKHLAVSMLAGIKELLRVQAQKASAIHNAVLEHGFPQMGTRRPAEEAAQQLEVGADALLQGEEADWWVLKNPQVLSWVFESLAADDKEIESATYIRALSGERQQGVTTVGQQMILTQAANRKFYVPSKQIERMATIIGERVCRMVDVRGEPLNIRGSKLTPQDIDGSYSVNVTFTQFDPLVQMDMRRLGMQEVAAGLKSPETYRESDALMENEAEEERRLLRAQVMAMPEVHEQMRVNAVREEGFIELADRLQEALAAKIKGPAAAPTNGAAPVYPGG